ncbi:MAG: nucleotide exchange factor GrpE [Planctomycetaceae bacterium]|jgi:molecular chaperone GrpE|nr:nucleotide exchange factor GrpE [Planctomycetaceae bacterium]MDP7275947.1 nucleotide exchange factor GrpE [Planctomycetaceae bacterium]
MNENVNDDAGQGPDPDEKLPREADAETGDLEGAESEAEAAEAEAIDEALAELSLDEQLEATRGERDENFDKWQRALAELENFRRRVQREKDELRTYQALPLARDLLPGLDNLQRALLAAEAAEEAGELVEGVKMVATQFDSILAQHGIEPIAAIGEPFDPAVHEAIQQLPSADHEPMTVIEEVERGFRLGDRVVRPAKVIVSMEPPELSKDAQPSETQGDPDGENDASREN